ncbi:MAG: hypothetical protein FWG40_00780 [Peptococcaceae bacterium]|nr:hypothetical protein [Peptococcaceae bacterium]
MDERQLDVLRSAIFKYGEQAQIYMAIEEMAELIHALSKHKRYGRCLESKVREEMSDVIIMLEQLKMMFGRVDEEVDKKVKRLDKRLREEDPALARMSYVERYRRWNR